MEIVRDAFASLDTVDIVAAQLVLVRHDESSVECLVDPLEEAVSRGGGQDVVHALSDQASSVVISRVVEAAEHGDVAALAISRKNGSGRASTMAVSNAS